MSERNRLRVGAVSYLNTKPLVYRLREIAPDIQLHFDLPSRLADSLATGRLDVALIPSVEYLQDPGYSIVSDACIACRGPVLSVRLLSRVPMSDIKTLALDEGSRTSVALARVLLAEEFSVFPQFQPLPIGDDPSTSSTDAVLVIGDRAIHPPREGYCESWDLGERWCQWTGLPFVFAMWTARAGVDVGNLATALEAARDAGVERLREIAAEEAGSVNLDLERCLTYLRDNLHFYLGDRERQGLEAFQQRAARLQIVPTYA